MSHIFCGVCKDIAWNIPNIKQWFEALSDCAFIIYEDSSVDDTPRLLKEWEKADHRIHVITEKFDEATKLNMSLAHTWDNKPCRMELIAAARNKLIDQVKAFIQSNPAKHFETIVMLDMDNKVPFPVDEFKKISIKYKDQFDLLICNGVEIFTYTMYDAYAFRSKERPFGPELIGERFWDNYSLKGIVKSNDLMPVLSGFNGCYIFDIKTIDSIDYSAFVTKEMNDYYLNNKEEVKRAQGQIQTHYRGVLLGEYLFGINGIFYHHNSGYNKAVVCEHVTMCFKLINKGFNRIFVCPEFIWEWTR